MAEPPEERQDEELVGLVRKGDARAKDTLARRHGPALRRLVRRWVNEADAEDVAQRALVRAFERLGEMRSDASFRAWLYTIATNLAKNHVRDRGRHETRELVEVDLVTDALGTAKLVAREARDRVLAEIGRLPEKQRAAVELRLFEGLSFREVGERIGCSEDSAKVNYHHALKRLRERLEEAGYG